ncbi:MAG: type II toxin-antitoxin system VapC family toxin [Verrucomicrobiae bacterium]
MYLDSAIIVKLLTKEDDSAFFQKNLAGLRFSISELSEAEVLSALLGKERAKFLTPTQRKMAWTEFQERVASREFYMLPLHSATLSKAGNLLEACHPHVALRTLDAIHLAACDLSRDFPLCTTDRRMREAAGFLKIPLFPETLL